MENSCIQFEFECWTVSASGTSNDKLFQNGVTLIGEALRRCWLFALFSRNLYTTLEMIGHLSRISPNEDHDDLNMYWERLKTNILIIDQ